MSRDLKIGIAFGLLLIAGMGLAVALVAAQTVSPRAIWITTGLVITAGASCGVVGVWLLDESDRPPRRRHWRPLFAPLARITGIEPFASATLADDADGSDSDDDMNLVEADFDRYCEPRPVARNAHGVMRREAIRAWLESRH